MAGNREKVGDKIGNKACKKLRALWNSPQPSGQLDQTCRQGINVDSFCSASPGGFATRPNRPELTEYATLQARSWLGVWVEWGGATTFKLLAHSNNSCDAMLQLHHGSGFGWGGIIMFKLLAHSSGATLQLRHGLRFGVGWGHNVQDATLR